MSVTVTGCVIIHTVECPYYYFINWCRIINVDITEDIC